MDIDTMKELFAIQRKDIQKDLKEEIIIVNNNIDVKYKDMNLKYDILQQIDKLKEINEN